MKLASLSLSIGLLSGVASSVSVAQTPARPPNLVVVLTDDQGYADVGFNGCKDIPTPNIDRIAKEGVRFTNGYVTYAVCGPSRAGLITGRYQDRFGFSRNPTIDPTVPNNGVPRSEKMISEFLKPAGYVSMAVGKWHLGTHKGLWPLDRGFDEHFGFLGGGHRYFPEELTRESMDGMKKDHEAYLTKILHNGKVIEIDDYLTDELSDAAVEFVGRKHDKPFFLYLAYNAPHAPMQATQKYLDRFPNIENKKRKTYAAMVSAVDDGVGRLLAKLDEQDLAKDTIVVFLSDNGGPDSNGSSNAPLRGHKSSSWEGGIRVPFAMRWTGTLPAGVDYDQPVISLDIAATIAELANVRSTLEKPLDGVNLVPYLTGKREGAPHEALHWLWQDAGRRVIRQGDWKFVLDKDGRHVFDLKTDIRESKDLHDAETARTEAMDQRSQEWAKDMIPPAFPGLDGWRPGAKPAAK